MPFDPQQILEEVRSGRIKEKDLWSRFTDEERQMYLQASKKAGWDAAPLSPKDTPLGGIPEAAVAATTAGKGISGIKNLIPSMEGSIGSTLGSIQQAGSAFAAKHPIVTGTVGLGIINRLPLPPEMKSALEAALGFKMMGSFHGAAAEEAPNGSKVTTTPPMSDAQFEATNGRPRLGGKPPRVSAQDAVRAGDTTPVRGGLDVDSMEYPPNVTRLKPGSGASRNQGPTPNYEDTHHSQGAGYDTNPDSLNQGLLDRLNAQISSRTRTPSPSSPSTKAGPSSSKQAKFHEADRGAAELEQLLERTGRLDPLNGESNGLLPAEPPAPRVSRRSPRK
jgi:hypothetical protein